MNVAVTYLIKNNKVLFLYKHSRNLFVAPGGKQEIGETIWETAKREFYEETGLLVNPRLATISQVYAKKDKSEEDKLFSLFIFYATESTGEMLEETREGDLEWKNSSEVTELPMFAGDKLILSHILQSLDKGEKLQVDFASFMYSNGYKELEKHTIHREEE